MTREEEINNASYAYWVNNYANIEFLDEEEKELHTQDIQDSFINGAEWADAHPRWVPVEDKLPIDSNNVLCKNASGELYVDSYVRRTMYGDIWRKSEKHPTHWMPLPQKPSSSEKPNNCEKGGEDEI